jgi:hypothetical protein
MKPSLITSVYFANEDALRDLLQSTETTASEVRADLVGRLKRGEGLVAVVPNGPPRALVLRSTVDPTVKGKPGGDDLTPLPFG